jgi:hypothetical protein
MMQFLKPAQDQVQATLAVQKQLLEAYEQASRDWLARVQSEFALWSDLGKKLVSTRSVPEVIEAYGECLSAQMKMTAEDGQHLFNDWQQITQKVTKSLGKGNGRPAGRA